MIFNYCIENKTAKTHPIREWCFGCTVWVTSIIVICWLFMACPIMSSNSVVYKKACNPTKHISLLPHGNPPSEKRIKPIMRAKLPRQKLYYSFVLIVRNILQHQCSFGSPHFQKIDNNRVKAKYYLIFRIKRNRLRSLITPSGFLQHSIY